MSFVSFDYALFLPLVLLLYWGVPRLRFQNTMLLVASYVFYGWIHPWFCILIALSTVADYSLARCMGAFPHRKRAFLLASLTFNLGFLGFYKYFGFFVESFEAAAAALGFSPDPILFRVFLPVGISFYTFQSLSYTIDVYRGDLEPRRSLVDFALFVSLFPQLVAGPIERATHLLPQVEAPRHWDTRRFLEAWPLLIVGLAKKLIIADNAAIHANRVFQLEHPPLLLLLAGVVAFTVQILYDFSGYTDIARASARMMGFDLMENFKSPYLAISPSDFWRRWHISFSSWIRDYLYIPLGGSRVKGPWRFGAVVIATMAISGLWHGAAWNFVLWGLWHGAILWLYHQLGLGGKWAPQSRAGWFGAWAAMSCCTLFGWLLFRMPSAAWLGGTLRNLTLGAGGNELVAALAIAGSLALFAAPMVAIVFVQRHGERYPTARAALLGALVLGIAILGRESGGDFIYFRF